MSLWDQMSGGQKLGVGGVALLGVVGLTIWGSQAKGEPEVVVETDEAAPSAQVREPVEVTEISVYVSGAVRRPGVYKLKSTAMVQDAVYLAGGGTDWADFDRVNLASRMVDGQQVHVPYLEGDGVEPEGGVDTPTVVSINWGTKEDLMTLPEIGEVTAEKIIAYREQNGPFQRVEDLVLVPGIGEKTLDGLEGRIRL